MAQVKAGNQSTDDSLVLVKAGHYSTEDSMSRKRLIRAQRTPRPRGKLVTRAQMTLWSW
jgi:hypothetical protein